MLVTFVGCAGAGKNTIIRDMIDAHPERYDLLPTLTTRDMRPGEKQGDPYYFVTREEFEKQIADGMIYEHEFVHKDIYGGSRLVLAEKRKSGKTLLKDIDILGSATYKKTLSGEMRILSVFLYVSVEELLSRLRERGDKPEDIEVRSKRFDMEIGLSGTSDYMVHNISREATGQMIHRLILAELQNEAYVPAARCARPTEDEIARAAERIRLGEAPKPVRLGFNGKDIFILEGADRYEAARREGAFIQKVFDSLPDETIV